MTRQEKLKKFDEILVKFQAEHPHLLSVLAAIAVACLLILAALIVLGAAMLFKFLVSGR